MALNEHLKTENEVHSPVGQITLLTQMDILGLTEYPLMGLINDLLLSACGVHIHEDPFGGPKE